MKIIYNNYIPFKGYKLITIFNYIFVRKGTKISDKDYNHEYIHYQQEKELLFIFFYIWYLVEFIIKLILMLNWKKAYKSISFEIEAYNNQDNLNYKRNRYNWIKYII